MQVLYLAGPGNIYGTYKKWKNNDRDNSQFALTYSQQFFNSIRSKKIKGVKILSAKETPGLGDKIFNEDWLKKWVDRDKNYEFKVGIDSFAGATISPKAVHSELIKILKVYDEKVKK